MEHNRIVPLPKANDSIFAGFADNIGNDTMVSGKFGELLIAYYFVKQKLHVILANSVGFDLVVKDRKGKFFIKDRLIGINVKARQSKSISLDLEKDISKLKKASRIWNFLPYFGFVSPAEVLIFPSKIVSHSEVRTKGRRISSSKIKNLKRKDVIHFSWEIKGGQINPKA